MYDVASIILARINSFADYPMHSRKLLITNDEGGNNVI
jgi:hypothetical protein